ncbi:MAG: 30S ribosome-binding factor RbfA [Ignavibacteria bacterium]|nr:30S ribosome-binding factor RbfA [Ignavibacteria bacterium]
MSIRTEKVAEDIKHKLNTAMSRDLSEISGLGLVTISKVIISPDLKLAKVYLSFLGNKEPVENVSKKLIPRRSISDIFLAKHIIMKYMPDLNFYYDDTAEYADKMQKLINEIKEESPEVKSE